MSYYKLQSYNGKHTEEAVTCFPELHFGTWLPWTALCLCGLLEDSFHLCSLKANCKNTFKMSW